jgi:SulP family sulfate permease
VELGWTKDSWFGNVKGDLLAGVTVALALIPEAIAFSIIAQVDPAVGLYASFAIAVVIAFAGGRPGMISGATGAMALLFITLVAQHGVEYLFAATILTGILQVIMGILRLGRFITFVPHSVVIGFVNALAILIFTAQLTHFANASWVMYAMVAGTLGIIYGLPRLTKAVPSPLVAIVVMTALAIFFKLPLSTVGQMGEIPRTLPFFHLPMVPFTLETLQIIFPYAVTLSIVGLLESLLTATIVDEMTGTKSSKNVEVRGQGIANIVTGFFGGMAGCAMIGQSVINVKSGGRGRLSSLISGVVLLFMILVMGDLVRQIPMAALVGVMIMVSIGTFDWQSLRELRKIPTSDAVVMVVTVAIVVITHDLAKGVLAGVVLSALVYGWRSARIKAERTVEANGTKIYKVTGELFFASMTAFIDLFDPAGDPDRVVIDFEGSHVWDHSGVTGIAKVVHRYQVLGKQVTTVGLDEESQALVDRVGLAAPSQ